MPVVPSTTTSKSRRLVPSRRQWLTEQRGTLTRQPVPEQRRIKISVTVREGVLAAIDEEAKALGTNRSRLIDDVLARWRVEQRRHALARQYATPLTPAQREESTAWAAIYDVAAADMVADAAQH